MTGETLPCLPALPAFVVDYTREADGRETLAMRFESTDADAVHGIAVDGFANLDGILQSLRGTGAIRRINEDLRSLRRRDGES